MLIVFPHLVSHSIKAMEQQTFSKEEARQVLDRSARLQKFRKQTTFDLPEKLTRLELLDIGTGAGLNAEFIEMAIQELHELTRRSFVTDTHLIEEVELKSSAEFNEVWREIISELKYRMKGSPKIDSTNNKNEWMFEDRSGTKTLVHLRSKGQSIDLHLSRKIGFAKVSVESAIASGTFGLIVFGYFFLFLGTSLFDEILIMLAVSLASFVVFKRMNLSRRKKKQRQFNKLAEQVVEQILYVNRRDKEET